MPSVVTRTARVAGPLMLSMPIASAGSEVIAPASGAPKGAVRKSIKPCAIEWPSSSVSGATAGESSSVTAASSPSDCGLPPRSTERQRTTRASVERPPASESTVGSIGGTRFAPLTCTWKEFESSVSSSSGRSKKARISPFALWLIALSAGQVVTSLGVAESVAPILMLASCVSVGIFSSCPLRSWTWPLGL